MSITGAIIVYVIIWWIVFFSVLPIGIQSKNEEFKETIKGSDPGAPINPKIDKRFLITTIITSLLFIMVYYLVSSNLINLRNFVK